MAFTIRDEHLELLAGGLSSAEIEAALDELVLDNVDNLETFERFLNELKDCKGDLSEIVGRTHRPVSIEQFITDDYFLGMKIVDDEGSVSEKSHKVGIWRECYKAVCEIVNGKYVEALLMGAIGIGKSTMAQILTAYDLYLLSCERYPQIRLGLLPGFPIVFTCLNVTDQLAHKVTFAGLEQVLENVPYFAEHFPRDGNLKSMAAFPHNIRIEPSAAYAKKILGQNIIGGIVDELNFMSVVQGSKRSREGGEFHQAKDIYTTLLRRTKSRFDVVAGSIGHLCLVSSKGYPDDFTEQRKKEVLVENDGMTYIFDKAHWDVRPRAIFHAGKRFRVELGDDRYASRIMGVKEKQRDGSKILTVPQFFRKDFEQDLPGALRDFAGVATDTARSFFYDRDLIWQMSERFEEAGYDTPLEESVITFGKDFPHIRTGYTVPHPERPRAAHIDLSVSRDSCGIAVGFVESLTTLTMIDPHTGAKRVEEVPQVVYDVILTVRPNGKEQIEFAEIRQIIYMLRKEASIPIKWVTFDGFQSVDSRQILRKRKFLTDLLSVEKLSVYEDFRTAVFYHKRVMAPEHVVAFSELAKLEANFEKNSIDHPPNGSKDTCDAMVGVFTNLQNQRSSWSDSIRVGDLDDGYEAAVAVAKEARVRPRSMNRRRASRR